MQRPLKGRILSDRDVFDDFLDLISLFCFCFFLFFFFSLLCHFSRVLPLINL